MAVCQYLIAKVQKVLRIAKEKEEKMKVAFSYFLLKVPAIFTEAWTKKLIKKKRVVVKAF